MKICNHCGQEIPPTLTLDEYTARAEPRLRQIDRLAEKINFSEFGWENTREGERYNKLMLEQSADEEAAGL